MGFRVTHDPVEFVERVVAAPKLPRSLTSLNISRAFAVPGNMLEQPIPAWLQHANPLVKHTGKSDLVVDPRHDTVQIAVPAVTLAVLLLIVLWRFRCDAKAIWDTRSETGVRRIVHDMQMVLVVQSTAGVVSMAIFLVSPHHYSHVTFTHRLTAAFCTGLPMIMVGSLWSFLLVQASFVVTALPGGHFSAESNISTRYTGICWLFSLAFCALPGTLYVFISTTPTIFSPNVTKAG